MGEYTLLRKLEEAASRADQLVREKDEATARTPPLEREASELRNIISLAESKVDEMLKGGPDPEASKRLEELKQRFPLLFTLDWW